MSAESSVTMHFASISQQGSGVVCFRPPSSDRRTEPFAVAAEAMQDLAFNPAIRAQPLTDRFLAASARTAASTIGCVPEGALCSLPGLHQDSGKRGR